MWNKLFCSNVLYFGRIYSKLSAEGLPTWSYFSCQIFQGFYGLQQVLMAAGFGCEKDCVLSCETSYFAVMFCILAGFTPSCLPMDTQHGVISLAKSSKDFTDCSRFQRLQVLGAQKTVLSCETSYFAEMFCILAGFTPSCLPIES